MQRRWRRCTLLDVNVKWKEGYDRSLNCLCEACVLDHSEGITYGCVVGQVLLEIRVRMLRQSPKQNLAVVAKRFVVCSHRCDADRSIALQKAFVSEFNIIQYLGRLARLTLP